MVFNKFSYIARPGLTKPFAHGYAQSFVAATQQSSSPFPLNKSSHGKARPNYLQPHQYVHQGSPSSTQTPTSRAPGLQHGSTQGLESGLKAYRDAWQKLQHPLVGFNEWTQLQHIEPSLNSRSQTPGNEVIILNPSTETADQPNLNPSSSTDVLGSPSPYGNEISPSSDLPQGKDPAICQQSQSGAVQDTTSSHVIDAIKQQDSNNVNDNVFNEGEQRLSTSSGTDQLPELSRGTTGSTIRNHEEAWKSVEADAGTVATGAPSADWISPCSRAYTTSIEQLVTNSLPRHQSVLRVLDLYAEMLARDIIPEAHFLTRLVQILSEGALNFDQISDDLNFHTQLLQADTKFSAVPSPTVNRQPFDEHDDVVSNALQIFDVAISVYPECHFSDSTYEHLIIICARRKRIEDMLHVYAHLETHAIRPSAAVFPAMISAFALRGDINSSLECYKEYRSLAIRANAGEDSLSGRQDAEVYAALAKAYRICGKTERAQRFYDKIVDSFVVENHKQRVELSGIQDTIILEAFVQGALESGDLSSAMLDAESIALSRRSRDEALSRICIYAAQRDDESVASKYFEKISGGVPKQNAALALFAYQVRHKELNLAGFYWDHIQDMSLLTSLKGILMDYITMLMNSEKKDMALTCLENVLKSPSILKSVDITSHVRSVASSMAHTALPSDLACRIFHLLRKHDVTDTVIIAQIIRSMRPGDIALLQPHDVLVLFENTCRIPEDISPDVQTIRFDTASALLSNAVISNTSLDSETELALATLIHRGSTLPSALKEEWDSYLARQHSRGLTSPEFSLGNAIVHNTNTLSHVHDSYLAATDFAGSNNILDMLDGQRNNQNLSQALVKFRNIRRAGRHPRPVVYAKLIAAAAREGRSNLTFDILGMARKDIPVLAAYSAVRNGWPAILDAMIAACLMRGLRTPAEQYHQELIALGTAPSANTYGLYITSPRDSSKASDEASDAVKIFNRAISEGVMPTSFLYNALIGKLGKARRIDDCLRYFQEMRAANIAPTSVTFGTVVNALCRVSDEKFAVQLFDEMEAMPNYKARPAPYNSIIQYFLTTKRDRHSVLEYYDRMISRQIKPTAHTFKLLIDTYATLAPLDFGMAEQVLQTMHQQGLKPEAVHYASLIHAKGCVFHDLEGAQAIFDKALSGNHVKPHACLYQALLESMVANHEVQRTEQLLHSMLQSGVEMSAYIANCLIHGWSMAGQCSKAKRIYDSLQPNKREPSTYECMARAFLASEDRLGASQVVHEMLSRGYPGAVSGKMVDLIGSTDEVSRKGAVRAGKED